MRLEALKFGQISLSLSLFWPKIGLGGFTVAAHDVVGVFWPLFIEVLVVLSASPITTHTHSHTYTHTHTR